MGVLTPMGSWLQDVGGKNYSTRDVLKRHKQAVH
mgnify:CR=1 FL=1